MPKNEHISQYPTVKRLLADLAAQETKKQAIFYLARFETYIQRANIATDLEDLMGKRTSDTNGQVTHWEIMRNFVTDNKQEMSGIAFTSRKNASTAIRRWYVTNNLPLQNRKVAFPKEFKTMGKADAGSTTLADIRKLLLDGQPSPMMKAVILIQFQSGMGRSEVMRSFAKDGLEQLMKGTWKGRKYCEGLGEDVSAWNFDGKTPYPVNVVRVKTGDKFYTFLTRDALEAIKFHVLDCEERQGRKLKPTDALFAERNNLTKIDQNLRAIAERAKVNDFVEAGRINQRRYRVHLHGIRGLFNTVCDNAGIADKCVEFLMGHEWQKYKYSHAPYQTDENGSNVGLEHFRDEYRKGEPGFNVLSNPNGSVAVTRITALEADLKKAREERDQMIAEQGEQIRLLREEVHSLKRVEYEKAVEEGKVPGMIMTEEGRRPSKRDRGVTSEGSGG